MSGSLAAAGGDLDLMEAMRGRGFRAKSQAQMLREQAMSPVEIGSYNGIQGNFPVSQGFNKIAQGLLAGYMENQDREKAQAASDAQKAEGLAFAEALGGTEAIAPQPAMEAQMGTAPMPGDVAAESPDAARTRMALSRALMTTQGPDGQTPQGQGQGPLPAPMQGQRMEALPGQGAADDPGVVGQAAVAGQAAVPLTPAQRTAMLLQGQLSGNPGVARVAEFANRQDEVARLQAEKIDARTFDAEQNRLMRAALAAAASAQGQPARDEQARLIEQDKQYRGQAVEFATKYQNATPEDQKKLLIEAQFSANPYLTKGATHIGDLAAKVDASQTTASEKAEIVPPAALKLYSDNQAEYKISARNVGQVDRSLQLLDEGKLNFSAVGNALEGMRNATGFTTEASRNKAEFLNAIDQYTNDILNLAKGPQTDRDADRARQLIRNNLNDPKIVRTQLEKLRGIFASSQDTAGTALNIQGKSLKGLDHVPVSLSQPLAGAASAAAPTARAQPANQSGPGTQNSPIVVSSVADAMLLPPGTWIIRPNGTIGQVPAR
ncbi:hypothetical protein UFOVP1619_52 [uncultured Caudovirales phage]|uniref:Uncharacterized protein n=1 Tax=uncultured Caudovirales phage TaxID=2100421 RepID=A0A6J5SXU1_9CAUD|nr:hypothetical protein UFOVP1619_52 [uncultured Caudovirales phage]